MLAQTRSATSRRPRSAARSVVLVVNANTSRHRVHLADIAAAALLGAGARVELHVTTAAEEVREFWPDDPSRRVVLVGGDGTLHAAVNLPGPQPEIALLPTGAANNVCRSAGISLDLRAAAELAVVGRVRPLDLIEARTPERRYVVTEGLSVGFLASARVRYHAHNSSDVLAALRAGAGALAAFHPLAVRVTSAGRCEELALAQLFVANLPLYEFGLQVAPQADPTDATLDLVGIDAANRRAVLRMLVDLRRGTHLGRPNVHVWRADHAVIATHGCSPIVGDSNDLGPGPVELRAAPAALRIVRP